MGRGFVGGDWLRHRRRGSFVPPYRVVSGEASGMTLEEAAVEDYSEEYT